MSEKSRDFNTLVLKSDSGQHSKMTDPWVGHFREIKDFEILRISSICLALDPLGEGLG